MLDTDADRLNMIRALGGSDDVLVGDVRVTALLEKVSDTESFDEISVSTESLSLRCLSSVAQENGFAQGLRVRYPADPAAYYIADVQDEDGIAVLALRIE